MYVLMLAAAICCRSRTAAGERAASLDPAGAPVAAAVHRDRADGPIVATSDARGRFSIELPPASTAPAVFVVAPGFAPESVSARGDVERGEPRVVLQPATLAEQVTVTAGRRELRGVDAPAATSVVASADLLSVAALEADDALRQTPGFTLFRRSSSRAANPTTQGVTLRGLSASGAQPHAGARRRRAAERSVRRLGLLGPRAAGGDRADRGGARRHRAISTAPTPSAASSTSCR